MISPQNVTAKGGVFERRFFPLSEPGLKVQNLISSKNIKESWGYKHRKVTRGHHPRQANNAQGYQTLPMAVCNHPLVNKLLNSICQAALPWGSWYFSSFPFVALVHLVGWGFLRTESRPCPHSLVFLQLH